MRSPRRTAASCQRLRQKRWKLWKCWSLRLFGSSWVFLLCPSTRRQGLSKSLGRSPGLRVDARTAFPGEPQWHVAFAHRLQSRGRLWHLAPTWVTVTTFPFQTPSRFAHGATKLHLLCVFGAGGSTMKASSGGGITASVLREGLYIVDNLTRVAKYAMPRLDTRRAPFRDCHWYCVIS